MPLEQRNTTYIHFVIDQLKRKEELIQAMLSVQDKFDAQPFYVRAWRAMNGDFSRQYKDLVCVHFGVR